MMQEKKCLSSQCDLPGECMFKVHEPVVHPAHGVGIVREIKKQFILGREVSYFYIDFPNNDLDRVMIPVDKARELGLRRVVNDTTIEEMLAIIRDRDGTYLDSLEDESFHKRHREYLERVQSGNILEVAKVFKTLHERSKAKDLGLKEKFLMERAQKMILGELKFAKGITYEKAQALIEKVTSG
jgi:CarD family transcriptional regulator